MQEALDSMPELQHDERSMIATRIFAAPRKMVYEAWADPEQVKQWWGPNGFTLTIHEMDLRVGGKWSLTMHAPDGTDYECDMTFLEIIPMERVSLQMKGSGGDIDFTTFVHSLTFEDVEGGTRFTVRNEFPTREMRDTNVRNHGSVQGLRQLMDRLETLLTKY